MISVDTINSLLSLEGIDEEISEDELNILMNSKLTELESLVSVDITPKTRKQYDFHFSGKKFELNFYPVRELTKLTLDDVEFTDFLLNDDLGIIYFDKYVSGKLKVEYVSGLSDHEINSYFNPLLQEMILYTMTMRNIAGDGVLSSIKEGDVSINYDTSNSRGNRIWLRINELKSMYSTRVRMV